MGKAVGKVIGWICRHDNQHGPSVLKASCGCSYFSTDVKKVVREKKRSVPLRQRR